MKKLKLKLSLLEGLTLQQFLNKAVQSKPQTHEDRLYQVLLAELLYKLATRMMFHQKEYRFSISVASGIALLLYSMKEPEETRVEGALINKLIGLIDQQTL